MILTTLQQKQPQLSRAEGRLASVILDKPEDILEMTTAELAKRADVSGPMVSRLCKSIGCRSFPDFKLKLAQSLASGNSFLNQSVSASDSMSGVVNKLIDANLAALEYLRAAVNQNDLEQAVSTLCAADRIDVFGMGACASIAQDAQIRLFRMGTPTTAYIDNLQQRMIAAAATEGTVVLCISFTGRTRDMVEAAQTAKDAGAKIVSITAIDSPLGRISDTSITSGSELEDTSIYVPMATRIAILTLIDVLVTGMALARGPELDDHLQRIKHSLDQTKIEENN